MQKKIMTKVFQLCFLHAKYVELYGNGTMFGLRKIKQDQQRKSIMGHMKIMVGLRNFISNLMRINQSNIKRIKLKNNLDAENEENHSSRWW